MSTQSQDTEATGIVLQTPSGENVRVVLMDENDEQLRYVETLQEGVYGYENSENTITVVLEAP